VVHPGTGRPLRVSARVPADIEALRRQDAALADRWRAALREVLHGCLQSGYRVEGVSVDGCYVMVEEAR
jgi:predicted GNAT superfamily acetyltransferase